MDDKSMELESKARKAADLTNIIGYNAGLPKQSVEAATAQVIATIISDYIEKQR